jgi:hypothetical protein
MENKKVKLIEKLTSLNKTLYEFNDKFVFKLNFNELSNGDHTKIGDNLEERIDFIIELFNNKILVEGFYEKLLLFLINNYKSYFYTMIKLEKNTKNIESFEDFIDYEIFYNTFYLKIDFNKIIYERDHCFLGNTIEERL